MRDSACGETVCAHSSTKLTEGVNICMCSLTLHLINAARSVAAERRAELCMCRTEDGDRGTSCFQHQDESHLTNMTDSSRHKASSFMLIQFYSYSNESKYYTKYIFAVLQDYMMIVHGRINQYYYY